MNNCMPLICHIVPTPSQRRKTTSIVGTICDPTYLSPWLCSTQCPSPNSHFSPETWSVVNPTHPIPIAKHYHTLRWTIPLAHTNKFILMIKFLKMFSLVKCLKISEHKCSQLKGWSEVIYMWNIYISYFNFLFMEFSRVFIIIPKYLGSSGNNLPNN
jgi:hypothetical protein